MCGIVGIAASERVYDRAALATACRTLQHRGPDDAGEWWSDDGRVGLAQRRLAIIDLSPAGHQPMNDTSGNWIVYNGEIYNFRELRDELRADGVGFVSGSDTEVILAAYRRWGVDCLPRLKGMFAFAIYDSARRKLLLARDRVGEKPLFYTVAEGTIRFASELKALLSSSETTRRVNKLALDLFLAEGYVPGGLCIFEGFSKLPPAHALEFDVNNGAWRSWRYWQVPSLRDPGSPADSRGLLDELERLLAQAVRRQLVADVPVGVLLSGGVDSSLVTAMAARAVSGVRTFTVRFPGSGRYDETEHARLIARHFGTSHVELEAQPTTVELLPVLARQFDEPVIDSSMLPTYLVSRLVRDHCTVALGGDGGDELFGGYSHYDRLLRLEKMIGWAPRAIRGPMAALAGAVLPLGFQGRNWLQAAGADFHRRVPLVASYFDRRARGRLLAQWRSWPLVAEASFDARQSVAGDLLRRASQFDFENYLPEDLLVKVDRASMLTSLEVRAPFLDVDLVEFAFGTVPSSLKASPRDRKILLKQLAARVLPPEFDRRRKQGFSIPIADWLRSGVWLDYFRAVLLDPSQRWFDHSFIESLFAGQRAGRANGERLFGLVMLELWRREYRAELVG
jgi:asparagine synthase (glutamine-hydrolysing)